MTPNNYKLMAEKNLDLGTRKLTQYRPPPQLHDQRPDRSAQLKGLTVSALYRYMSGRPFSIIDTNIDADRNGDLQNAFQQEEYSGVRATAITVENKKMGVTAPTDPTTRNWMPAWATVFACPEPGRSTCSSSVSTSPTDRISPTRQETGGCQTFSSTTAWSRAGSRGNCKLGRVSASRRM